jgi:cytidyltransferase-like protein
MSHSQVIVSGPFDDIRSRHLRFLEEASRLGEVSLLLWGDDLIRQETGQAPKFPLAERRYFLEAVRYVGRVIPVQAPDEWPTVQDLKPQIHATLEGENNAAAQTFCARHGLIHRSISLAQISGFPEPPPMPSPPGRKKVVVTGCYDWFHSGHVRFCEEVSAYGDLYVCVGHDTNIRFLKGEGHPLLCQEERRYVVGSIKYVKQCLISTGDGWVDADPEIRRLKPDIYAVNEDGDRGGKREYCEKLGIEYLVLKRTPAPGLPKRSSTNLRGF